MQKNKRKKKQVVLREQIFEIDPVEGICIISQKGMVYDPLKRSVSKVIIKKDNHFYIPAKSIPHAKRIWEGILKQTNKSQVWKS